MEGSGEVVLRSTQIPALVSLNILDEFPADRMAKTKAQRQRNLMARGKSEALVCPEPRVHGDKIKDGLSHGSDQEGVL